MDETAGKSAEPSTPKTTTPNALGHGAGPSGTGKKVRVTVKCPERADFNGGSFPGYWCAGAHFTTGESTAEIDADRLQELKDDPTVTLVSVEDVASSGTGSAGTNDKGETGQNRSVGPKAGFGEPGVTTEMNSGAKAMGHDDPKELASGPGKPPKSK